MIRTPLDKVKRERNAAELVGRLVEPMAQSGRRTWAVDLPPFERLYLVQLPISFNREPKHASWFQFDQRECHSFQDIRKDLVRLDVITVAQLLDDYGHEALQHPVFCQPCTQLLYYCWL